MTHERFVEKVEALTNGTMKILSRYSCSREKVKYKCLTCGHVACSFAGRLTNTTNYGCAECGRKRIGDSRRTPIEDLVRIINEKTNYVNFDVPFTGTKQHAECSVCGRHNNVNLGGLSRRLGWSGGYTPVHCCHDSAAASNSGKASSKRKTIVLNGKERKVQGYEPQAIRFLLSRPNVQESDIKLSRKNIPTIFYEYEGRLRSHFPDMFIPKLNALIEIKSTFTAGLLRSSEREDKYLRTLQLKRIAALKAGYRYAVLVINKGSPLTLPKGWEHMSLPKLRKSLGRDEFQSSNLFTN